MKREIGRFPVAVNVGKTIAFHMKMMQMYCGVSADELRHADGAEIVVASLHVPFHAPRRFPGRFGE